MLIIKKTTAKWIVFEKNSNMLVGFLIVILCSIECKTFVLKSTNDSSTSNLNNNTLISVTKNLCFFKCGIQNILTKTNDDIDGHVAFGQFPWMLGVLENNSFRFGASLIHPKMAMTVAHYLSPRIIYTVRAGEWNWDNNNEPFSHEDQLTEKVILHPNYTPEFLRNDIGLLLLKSPFTLKPHINPVCLPNSLISYNPNNCAVTGWGEDYSKKGQFQNILRQVKLSVLPTETCKLKLQSTKLGSRFKVHESYLCALRKSLQDTNKGDGGGPLVCSNTENSQQYQVGILSWGLRNRSEEIPNVYTSVVLFTDWIFSVMRSYDLNYCV